MRTGREGKPSCAAAVPAVRHTSHITAAATLRLLTLMICPALPGTRLLPPRRLRRMPTNPVIGKGTRRDQGQRRNGRDAELDEGVGRAPQDCQQQQKREFGGSRGSLVNGVHASVRLI